jgi:hypothetical protein
MLASCAAGFAEGGPKIMEKILATMELTGTVDENRQLQLDRDLPIPGSTQVRVIVPYPLEESWDENGWLQAAA